MKAISVRNSWWDGKAGPGGSVVPSYCCRGAMESMRYTFCEQHRLHTREQSRHGGFTAKMQRLNTLFEERQLYAKQKTICTQEEMRHLGFHLFLTVYKLDVEKCQFVSHFRSNYACYFQRSNPRETATNQM